MYIILIWNVNHYKTDYIVEVTDHCELFDQKVNSA